MALCLRKKKASEVPCLYHGLPGIVYRDVRVYGYTTMAMHDNEYPPPVHPATIASSRARQRTWQIKTRKMYIMDGLVLIRGHVVPRTPTPTHYSLPLHAVGYIFGALYQVYCYTPAPCEHVRHLSSAPAFLWSRDILQAFTCRPLLLFVWCAPDPKTF